MKKLTRILSIILLLSMVFSLAACGGNPAATPTPVNSENTNVSADPAQSAAPTTKIKWSIGSSSSSSAPYNCAVMVANFVTENQDWLSIDAQVTAGFNENAYLAATGEVTLGMITAADLLYAYRQTGNFEGASELGNLRRVCLYGLDYGHQVVRADSDIESLEDLNGKKLNINTPSSSTAARNRALIEALGNEESDYQIFEIATGSSYDGLRDKVFDSTWNGYEIGNAKLIELASSVPVRLLPIDQVTFDKFNELLDGTLGYGAIPANTYNGQTEDVPTWIGYNMLCTSVDTPEEEVYQFMKAYWDNIEEVAKLNNSFAALTLDMAAFGPQEVPLHPGAERYLKEKGLI